jgi:hypothetical protein
MKKATITLAVLLLSTSAFARFKGSISFNDNDRAIHVDAIKQIAEDAGSCLGRMHKDHKDFLKRMGFSKYYGTLSWFSRATKAQQRAYMKKRGVDPKYLSQLKGTSCIGLALKCLGEGFKKSQQGDMWNKVERFTRANGSTGLALLHGLRKLGWTVAYWNPDPSMNKKWDQSEKKKHPGNPRYIWGHHEIRYNQVKNKKSYYFNKVDNDWAMVGFKDDPPKAFMELPLFIGVAHNGYHVFPGVKGINVEAHGSANFGERNAIETKWFKPNKGHLKTGIMAIPPTYIKTFKKTKPKKKKKSFFGLF